MVNEETAISIAAFDHKAELILRRDGFIERLYAPPPRKAIIFLSGMVPEAGMIPETVAAMMGAWHGEGATGWSHRRTCG